LLSTPRQIVLQEWLGLPRPRYLHFPIATDAAGHKLSKQTDAQAIDLRDPAPALAAALALLGQPPDELAAPAAMLAAALARWDPGRIPPARALPVTFCDRSGATRGV